MNEKPDLEKILGIILNQISNSQKSLVEIYLTNPDTLSSENREKAAEILKKFLAKYPELSKKHTETKELHPSLRKFKYDLTALKTKYETWRDAVNNKTKSINLKSCCIDILNEYIKTLDSDINELKIREQQLKDLEGISLKELDLKEEQERWCIFLEEKNKRFKAIQTRYQRNEFVKEGEWRMIHVMEGHYKPLSHDNYEDW